MGRVVRAIPNAEHSAAGPVQSRRCWLGEELASRYRVGPARAVSCNVLIGPPLFDPPIIPGRGPVPQPLMVYGRRCAWSAIEMLPGVPLPNHWYIGSRRPMARRSRTPTCGKAPQWR